MEGVEGGRWKVEGGGVGRWRVEGGGWRVGKGKVEGGVEGGTEGWRVEVVKGGGRKVEGGWRA